MRYKFENKAKAASLLSSTLAPTLKRLYYEHFVLKRLTPAKNGNIVCLATLWIELLPVLLLYGHTVITDLARHFNISSAQDV